MPDNEYQWLRGWWVGQNLHGRQIRNVGDATEGGDVVTLRQIMGATGIVGSTGPTGPSGVDGIDGIDGATGPTGPSGPNAVSGATGNLAFINPFDSLIYVPSGINALGDVDTQTITAAPGDGFIWDGTNWTPGVPISQGQIPLAAVRAATTGPVNLASPSNILDSVTVLDGDRLLVKDQTDTRENGVYIFGATLTRAPDANTEGALVVGNSVLVSEGAVNGGVTFLVSLLAADLPWTPDVDSDSWFATFSKLDIEAGDGLSLNGKRIDVEPGNGVMIYNDSVAVDFSALDQHYARSLHQLNDVDVYTVPPSDGQGIAWSFIQGKWIPADLGSDPLSAGRGLISDDTAYHANPGYGIRISAGDAIEVDTVELDKRYPQRLIQLDDVSVATPNDQQALIWDEGKRKWVAGDVATDVAEIPDEVFIGATAPTGPVELWYDPTAAAEHKLIGQEFHTGDTDPKLNPDTASAELWTDTSIDPAVLKYWDGAAWVVSFVPPPAETSVPTGGAVGRVLRKQSATDGDVGWDGDISLSKNLTVQDNITTVGDSRGLWMAGGGAIYKKSGTGIVIRRAANSPAIQVEDNAGNGITEIITVATGDARYLQASPTYVTLPTQVHGWVCPTPPAGSVRIYSNLTNDGRQEMRVMWDSGASTAFTYE